MDFGQDANYAIFGTTNNSQIPAVMLNPDANGDVDWDTILTNGIKGAANGAIQSMVQGAVNSGQLVLQQPATRPLGGMNLLLIGAVLYFVLGK